MFDSTSRLRSPAIAVVGALVLALPAAGARPLSSPVVVVARDRRISFWADPEGNVLELVDRRGGDQETRWTRTIVIREPLQ